MPPIPSMDKCLKALHEADPALRTAPQKTLKRLINDFWSGARERLKNGKDAGDASLEANLPALLDQARAGLRPALRRVFNGTGVVIHTNLGRSVLAEEAQKAVLAAASGYCNLELDLKTGERGGRSALTDDLLRQLTGAEASLVVNNNAAAVFLVLNSLCAGGETIVSRGELVEIGGSFRIPDIMAKSGTSLREVGTTNRCRIGDYRSAINERTKALMRVHASNFRIIGFHEEASVKELKSLAQEKELPLIVDLGSGSLLDFSDHNLPGEPTASEVIAQGADIICFSGDKALGGPQAGIIAGKKELVDQLKANPLARALRCGKLSLAALEATLRLYLDGDKAMRAAPTPAMLAKTRQDLRGEARSLARRLKAAFAARGIGCQISLEEGDSRAGGGSFPECPLPTTLVCLHPDEMGAQELRDRLLQAQTPLIGRLEKDSFRVDPRTLFKKDYPEVARTVAEALARQ